MKNNATVPDNYWHFKLVADEILPFFVFVCLSFFFNIVFSQCYTTGKGLNVITFNEFTLLVKIIMEVVILWLTSDM